VRAFEVGRPGIESLTFNSVLGRLSAFCWTWASGMVKNGPGDPHPPGGFPSGAGRHVGTAREMVTRVLSRFARLGCLEMEEKYILLKDGEN